MGVSGGIDSALVATIATDALGPQNVRGVAMPGPYSSEGSLRDARSLAKNLGIELLTMPILAIRFKVIGMTWRPCLPGCRRTRPRKTCKRASAGIC